MENSRNPTVTPGQTDGEKETYDDVPMSDETPRVNGGPNNSSSNGQALEGIIVAPEGPRAGILARIKKPRPLPSRRRLMVMM